MHTENLHRWQHSHAFGQDRRRPGERRTQLVILITATMMAIEIAAGLMFGSMALLADGLHMGSHTAALGIAAFAYVYARRHAHDPRYSFGTGKINALGGFTGALLLAVFALFMAWESIWRMVSPVSIAFDQAIGVAVIGLIVNGASMWLLGGGHDHHHDHAHHHGHEHHHHVHNHQDHNLQSAYLHVLADTLTSALAIFALLAGKYFGLNWMDPLMGVAGAILVGRWSWGLLRSTSEVLLDRQGPDEIRDAMAKGIEAGCNDRVADLHLWSIGPQVYAAAMTVVTEEDRTPDDLKHRLPRGLGLEHVTVEVHRCPDSLKEAGSRG